MKRRAWAVALVAISLLSLLFVLGCGPLARTGAAVNFCTDHAPTEKRAVEMCEDFSNVDEGALPTGWTGGGGLLVRRTPDLLLARALGPFEQRESYGVVVPWSFGGDFEVEAIVRPDPRQLAICGDLPFTLAMGGANVTVAGKGTLAPPRIGINDTGADLPSDRFAAYHVVSVRRTGNVYKVLWDRQQVLLARYENAPDVEGIAIKSGCQGFTLGALRASGGPKQGDVKRTPGPTAAVAAKSDTTTCAPGCKFEEACVSGACVPLCPGNRSEQVAPGLTRTFQHVDMSCAGGPCVYEFDGTAAAGVVATTADRLGCEPKGGIAYCCTSPVLRAQQLAVQAAAREVTGGAPLATNDRFRTCHVEIGCGDTASCSVYLHLKAGRVVEAGAMMLGFPEAAGAPRDTVLPTGGAALEAEGQWLPLNLPQTVGKIDVRYVGDKMELKRGKAMMGVGVCTWESK